ncbi:hypothetical protein [Variovorax sp. PBL-E5]|uniref:hypothetical protein n=1 Tax=Variovorax sp. PBL-E5 TaxID=434014 RepID=UPI00131837AA|nr:hypothetical protein [Variovorax sp. PBL-E5]VTU16303.1 hypothetical protein E5CHR_00099 [Variovorax sp. PBL-E5]
MAANAQVTGKVEYRAGDGPMLRIPEGPIEVEMAADSAVLSWGDEGRIQSTAIPLLEYRRFVDEGMIIETRG